MKYELRVYELTNIQTIKNDCVAVIFYCFIASTWIKET